MESGPLRIGKAIRYHRRRLGLSQEALGQKIGATQAAVSYWESGHARPTLDNIVQLVSLFAITADELLRPPHIPDDENGEAA